MTTIGEDFLLKGGWHLRRGKANPALHVAERGESKVYADEFDSLVGYIAKMATRPERKPSRQTKDGDA